MSSILTAHRYTGGTARNVARERIVDAEVSKIADIRPTRPFNRFTTQPTIGGYEVIDSDGRTVDVRDDLRQATGVAFKLNRAAAQSPRSLASALGSR